MMSEKAENKYVPTLYITKWDGDNLMKISEAFASATEYLTKERVTGKDFPEVLTISRVEVKTVGKQEKLKLNVYFKEIVERLRLNKENAFSIANIVGSQDTDDWKGEQISVYIDKDVMRGTEKVGGIRIRAVGV